MEQKIGNMTWEEAKEHLSIAAVDVRRYRQELQDIPHRKVDGLACYPHLKIRQGDKVGSVPVTNEMAEKWGLPPDQVLDEAMAAAQEHNPLQIAGLTDVLQSIAFFEGVPASLQDNGLVMLSNREGFMGAGALFYPGALDQAAEKMGGNYYILPSSVHEVLLLADDGSRKCAELENMVQTINATEVLPTEVLSNTVYHYDAASKTLEKACTFEKRIEREAGKSERPNSVLGRLEAGKQESVMKDTARHSAGRPTVKGKNPPAR